MKILKRKIKAYKTKKEAEKQFAILDGIKSKPKYSLCNVSEDNIVMTEKEITTEAEMVDDSTVDTTEYHFCTHNSKGRGNGACKILKEKEAKEEFKKLDKEKSEYEKLDKKIDLETKSIKV